MDPNLEVERQRQAAYRRLGTDVPRCLLCGESAVRCLELHHLAGQAYDGQTVILCRNCHRKQTDPSANGVSPPVVPIMEAAGRLLLGVIEFMAELLDRLRVYARQLLEGAAVCPWPYGWVGAPAHG